MKNAFGMAWIRKNVSVVNLVVVEAFSFELLFFGDFFLSEKRMVDSNISV